MVAQYAFERCQTIVRLLKGVLCILGPHKEFAPVRLVVLAVSSEKVSEFLVQSFLLSIGLGVITGGEADFYIEQSEEG